MTNINDIKLMNDTLINYYTAYESNNEKKLLKHRIIGEILNTKDCFKKMTKEDAIKILKDLGIDELNLEVTYNELVKQI